MAQGLIYAEKTRKTTVFYQQ